MPIMMNKKRQRKFIIKERRKEARKIQNELDAHRDYQRSLGWAKPERPIINRYHPWKRSFKLRYPHIMSHANKIAREMLPLINNFAYSKNKKFVEFHNLAFGYKYAIPISQKLSWIDGRTFDKLNAEQQEFFNPVPWWKLDFNIRQWGARLRIDARYYEFKRPYLFDFKVEKNYVEKVRVFDPVEESKYQENRERFYGTSNMYDKKAKLLNYNNENSHGKKWKNFAEEKVFGRESKKEIHEAMRGGEFDETN